MLDRDLPFLLLRIDHFGEFRWITQAISYILSFRRLWLDLCVSVV